MVKGNTYISYVKASRQLTLLRRVGEEQRHVTTHHLDGEDHKLA